MVSGIRDVHNLRMWTGAAPWCGVRIPSFAVRLIDAVTNRGGGPVPGGRALRGMTVRSRRAISADMLGCASEVERTSGQADPGDLHVRLRACMVLIR